MNCFVKPKRNGTGLFVCCIQNATSVIFSGKTDLSNTSVMTK